MQFRQEIKSLSPILGNFSFTRKTTNKKTGPMPVSTSPQSTCPLSCPFYGGQGCYASAGGPLRLHWVKISSLARGISYDELLTCVSDLPSGTYWRHNQAGDLYGADDMIDTCAAELLVRANASRHGFTYTHKSLSYSENERIISYMNTSGFTVNISCNSLCHLEHVSSEFPEFPLTVVLPHDISKSIRTFSIQSGKRVVICPATYSTLTCQQCKLCAHSTRNCVVGFPAHGTKKRAATDVASQHIHEYL